MITLFLIIDLKNTAKSLLCIVKKDKAKIEQYKLYKYNYDWSTKVIRFLKDMSEDQWFLSFWWRIRCKKHFGMYRYCKKWKEWKLQEITVIKLNYWKYMIYNSLNNERSSTCES